MEKALVMEPAWEMEIAWLPTSVVTRRRLAPGREVQRTAERDRADDGDGSQARHLVHGGQPPRNPKIPLLRCRFDGQERGLHNALGDAGRARLDE